MIIEPDFLTHWKTRMLISLLNDKAAPLYLIAFWSHCQQRKTDSFDGLSKRALKAICQFEGDEEELFDALVESGFIEVDGDKIIAKGWAEANKKLFANWNNGGTGGRPNKTQTKPNENPTITQKEPTGNPLETHEEPKHNPTETQHKPIENPNPNWVNPLETDKIREEKIREEYKRSPYGDPKELLLLEGSNEPQQPTTKPKRKQASIEDKMPELKATYTHVNVEDQLRRMILWCEAKRKQPTYARFLNWLNRIEKPIETEIKGGRW